MMKLSLALPSIAFFVLSAASIGAYEMDIGFRKSENTNCSTIMEIICEKDGEYETETLCEAIQLAGLQDDLDTELWTLFAPTDSAFDDLSDAALESLLGGPTMDDTRGLVELLAFHVVPGEGMNSTELTCDARTFMANEEFSVTICEDDRIFQAGVGNPTTNYPEITEANIEACNGVIHLIDELLLFKEMDEDSNSTSITDALPKDETLTEAPSVTPTDFPSMEPSLLPSDGPSLLPSDGPSLLPSDGPSLEPSLLPSDGPSLMPSDGPSMEPSLLPSDGPSLEPSLLPSDGPSLMPSDGPSIEPSLLPSDGPSLEPSLLPSDGPSLLPSDGPSLEPSLLPSDGPSLEPSLLPSDGPSLTPTDKPVPPPAPCSITELACDSKEFTHLCAALRATGLDSVLGDSGGNYTVFAPTDAAFEKLGEVALAHLMEPENVGLLSNILSFHTVEDQLVYSQDLKCRETIEMSNGRDSRTVCAKSGIFQKGAGNSDEQRPEIIELDIESCNGVMHVVTEVMLFKLPQKLGVPPRTATFAPAATTGKPTPAPTTAPETAPPTAPETEPPVPCKNIDELVCEAPDFSILCGTLEVTGVGESLKSGTWTLFAPNNEAFLKLPPDYVDVVTSNNEQLKKLLLFHAVPGTALYAEDLPCRAGENLLEMANGKDTRTICEDVRPREPFPKYQKGNFNCDDKPPEIIVTDVGACNGVIHAIDDVMLYREPN